MNEEPLLDSDLHARSASAETQPLAAIAAVTSGARRVRQTLGRVIVGQDEAIDLALVTLLAGGHALIEGVPGVGKTLLVKALARAVGGEFQRIQFTPDLMPADITGTSVFDLKTQNSGWCAGRFSRICYSATKSIGRRRSRDRLCSKPCKSVR